MANLSSITLPNGDSYDIKDSVARGSMIHVVKGTQTAATQSWTGNIDVPALYDGLTILYYLPYAGTSTSATLNLTLSDGETKTGAIYVYYTGTTRATTHFAAGSTILLTYWSAGSISVSGEATAQGRWTRGDYSVSNSNNYDRLAITQAVVTAGSAITATSIIVANTDGTYKNLKSGTAFDISYPILYSTAAIAAGAKSTANTSGVYVSQYLTITNTQSITLTFPEPVYIKGQLSGNVFTPISTTPLVQALPSTADGYEYIYLGMAYSATAMWLYPIHPIFAYRNGAIRTVSGDADTVNGMSAGDFVAKSGDTMTGDLSFNSGSSTSGTIHYNSTTKTLDFIFS